MEKGKNLIIERDAKIFRSILKTKQRFKAKNPVSINHFAALHNPHSRDILQMTIMHPVLILNYDPDNISPCSFFFMQVVHGQDSATSKR